MARHMLRDPRGYNRLGNAHSPGVCQLLGLRAGQKLPAEGMPPRIIQGIEVWVAPLKPRTPEEARRQGKRSTHRVMARCPDCGKVLSVGRLHQHVC